MEVSGQLHALTALSSGRNSGIQCIVGWIRVRASLDDVEKTKPVVLSQNRTQIIQLAVRLCTKYAIYYPTVVEKQVNVMQIYFEGVMDINSCGWISRPSCLSS
jgi:hypothetical protein